MPIHLPTFIVTAWLLSMLPGPGQALMFRQTLDQGRRAAWASITGTATGIMIWSAAAAAGLSAVLLANPAVYGVVRVAGGAVLVGLGLSTLMSLRKDATRTDATRTDATDPDREAVDHLRGWWRGYLAGLATNLGNPKAGVFAISLLPQFTSPEGPVLLSSLALGLVWSLVTACWYAVFVFLVDRGRTFVSRPAFHRRLQGLTGGVLILLGAAVAVGA